MRHASSARAGFCNPPCPLRNPPMTTSKSAGFRFLVATVSQNAQRRAAEYVRRRRCLVTGPQNFPSDDEALELDKRFRPTFRAVQAFIAGFVLRSRFNLNSISPPWRLAPDMNTGRRPSIRHALAVCRAWSRGCLKVSRAKASSTFLPTPGGHPIYQVSGWLGHLPAYMLVNPNAPACVLCTPRTPFHVQVRTGSVTNRHRPRRHILRIETGRDEVVGCRRNPARKRSSWPAKPSSPHGSHKGVSLATR